MRTERIGPTSSGACELNIAAEPGDAALDDLLVDDVGVVDAGLRGRASGVFSTFTVSARPRLRSPPVGSGRPVSGAVGHVTVVVVVGGAVLVVVWRAVVCRLRRRRRTRAATIAHTDTSTRDDGGRPAALGSVASHRLERRDAVVERRMGVEQRGSAGSAPFFAWLRSSGFLDPEVRGAPSTRWIDRLVVLELLERRDQPRRVARELHARRVGEELALAAHRELHERAMIGARRAAANATIAMITPTGRIVAVVVVGHAGRRTRT